MGQNDGGALSMSVYASAVRRRERLTGARLREFDTALQWAAMDRNTPEAPRAGALPESGISPGMASQSHKLASSPDSSAG